MRALPSRESSAGAEWVVRRDPREGALTAVGDVASVAGGAGPPCGSVGDAGRWLVRDLDDVQYVIADVSRAEWLASASRLLGCGARRSRAAHGHEAQDTGQELNDLSVASWHTSVASSHTSVASAQTSVASPQSSGVSSQPSESLPRRREPHGTCRLTRWGGGCRGPSSARAAAGSRRGPFRRSPGDERPATRRAGRTA